MAFSGKANIKTIIKHYTTQSRTHFKEIAAGKHAMPWLSLVTNSERPGRYMLIHTFQQSGSQAWWHGIWSQTTLLQWCRRTFTYATHLYNLTTTAMWRHLYKLLTAPWIYLYKLTTAVVWMHLKACNTTANIYNTS